MYYVRTANSSSRNALKYYLNILLSESSQPTSAKIRLFTRTHDSFPRNIANKDDVIVVLQKYSSVPVEIITTTEHHSIQEQIRTFNDFDILVTTHGSHMANGVFTMHPYTKAVVEIVPFVYDSTFFRNYVNDLGFADYLVSTEHLTVKPQELIAETNSSVRYYCAFMEPSDFSNRNCKTTHISDPPKLAQVWILNIFIF